MIKQNIKMRVTPEQSQKIQEICFKNGAEWNIALNKISHIDKPYLAIEPAKIFYKSTEVEYSNIPSLFQEIDADLFIRTNGTCEDVIANDYDIDFIDEKYIELEKKVFNLKKQLERYVTKIGNQKEEITRLLNQKEELEYKLNGVTNLVELSIQNDDLWAKQLEEKDTIIKYLESKLYN